MTETEEEQGAQPVAGTFTLNGESIRIEKSIPIPTRMSRSVWRNLTKLEIGNSFLASQREEKAIRNYAMQRGFRICSRTTRENDLRPMRVWLVEKPAALKKLNHGDSATV